MQKDYFAPETGNTGFIDLLRTIGILQVVLFHVVHGIVRFAPQDSLADFTGRMPGALNFAWQAYGVDTIFLVSAFLLSWSLIAEIHSSGRISLKRFYLGRVGRILPVYYLALILFAIGQGSSWQEILATAFFVTFLFDLTNVVPVGWSMEVMILYFIALPFIISALHRVGRPLLWLSLAIVIIAVWRYVYLVQTSPSPAHIFLVSLSERTATPAMDALYFQPWFRLPAFLMGTLAAYLLGSGLLKTASWPAMASAFGVIAVLWLPVQNEASWAYTYLPSWVWVLYWAAAPVVFARALAIIMIWGLERGLRVPWRLKGPWVAFSQMIFPVYLFHMPFLIVGALVAFGGSNVALLANATSVHVVITFAVTALVTLAFAWPIDRYIERPIRARIKQYLG